MERTKPLRGELARLRDEIHQYAVDYGLDFYPVIFEICNYDTVCILAANDGFPTRYPHWRFGMAYDQLSKGNTYGFQKIYELVINTDPCYAYLLSSNRYVDQKLVMAHVYGHADFFKNNAWFSGTNRKMMNLMANYGTKIRRYIEKYGENRVENFIDTVLSFENLIDVDTIFEKERSFFSTDQKEVEIVDSRSQILKSFMRSNIDKNKIKNKKSETPLDKIDEKIKGSKDIMKFLIEHAPIEDWEADIIGMLREEAYYFLPQRMTKIMNEGWASYWHSKILTQKALRSSEIIDFADIHAGVMAMNAQNINPYKIGIELMRDIEYRWDTGKFGEDYFRCENMQDKEGWNRESNLGRKKIFEVRKTHNDVTFIDEFFTQDFCERMQIFTYEYNPQTGRQEIKSKDFLEIKKKLLNQLTNFGSPIIKVESANFKNRGELLLKHIHQGIDLDVTYATDTMTHLYKVWKRPVSIRTIYQEKETIYTFDGEEFKEVS